MNFDTVIGVPYDLPIVGYGTNTVNLLRLWSARSSEKLDLEEFNRGGYVEAVRSKALSETISKVLYPRDDIEVGRELRLVQQHFFVTCTLADIMRRYDRNHDSIDQFADNVAIQLNDTHPALGVAELMRILVDERAVPWDKAWEITTASFGYTNHTLMPEALEVLPVDLLSRIVPRHLQIIFEINQRFLEGVVEKRWPGDAGRRQRLSIIQEQPYQAVRMAHLSIVGSHKVNGVAQLHTDLIRSHLVPNFAKLWPEKFQNKTNGVTPRRWLLMCNPNLSSAISKRIGNEWPRDLESLNKLVDFADDPEFQEDIGRVKQENKQNLSNWMRRRLALNIPAESLFDVQVKRLHEYKRQLLNILQVVMRYQRILNNPSEDIVPRVVLFGAKAAPAYFQAKLIIKLINDVAKVINHDERIGHKLKVAFLPNYCVSMAERIIPATDLSEQISTAGTEASGTGNMKFAMNGALTIGTLDGANIEIRDAVGKENFFLFGLTADEVNEGRQHHNAWHYYHNHGALRSALDAIANGEFCPDQPDLFKPIFDSLTRNGDHYMVLADIRSYLEAQEQVDRLWRNPAQWARQVILNIAHIGHFSSDRTIRQYAEEIWNIHPIQIDASPRHPPNGTI